MIIELLQIVLGSLLVLFVPGFLLSKILFPDLSLVSRLPLAAGLSMVIVMILGFLFTVFAILGLMPGITALTVWVSLLVITSALYGLLYMQSHGNRS